MPGERFVDAQIYGPYALWHHTHEFEADGDGTIVRDTVRYALPFGVFGGLAHLAFVRRDLEKIFDYRTVSFAFHAVGAVIADRAEERVLARGELDGDRRGVTAGDRLGRRAVDALDHDGVRLWRTRWRSRSRPGRHPR